MRDSWTFYSKFHKYIIEKYYNPEIEHRPNYIKYRVIINNNPKNFRYYPATDDWTDIYLRYLTFKELRYYCINLANFIGYE
jgi:hypothetical protein